MIQWIPTLAILAALSLGAGTAWADDCGSPDEANAAEAAAAAEAAPAAAAADAAAAGGCMAGGGCCGSAECAKGAMKAEAKAGSGDCPCKQRNKPERDE